MASKRFPIDIDLMKNQMLQARFENSATAPTGPLGGQMYFNTADNTFRGWNGTAWIDLSMVITGTTNVKGEIANANTSPAYPAAPAVGDYYFITTTAGTVGGTAVEVGDQLVYSTSGWFVIQRNLQAATQALAGFARFATQAEANAGADLTTAITPGTLASFMLNFLYARKYRMVIASLAANTATTVTHGLAVANIEDVQVQCYQGGQRIELAITPTTVNALTVTSNIALSTVTVVVQG